MLWFQLVFGSFVFEKPYNDYYFRENECMASVIKSYIQLESIASDGHTTITMNDGKLIYTCCLCVCLRVFEP